MGMSQWGLLPVPHLSPPTPPPPGITSLFNCDNLPWLGAPHPPQHYVFPLQLHRENKTYFSLFLLDVFEPTKTASTNCSLVAFMQKLD